MNRKYHYLRIAGIILGISLTAISCSKDNANNVTNNGPKVQLTSNSKFGNILTDSSGRALYFYSLDANGSSACTGQCAVVWPVFHASATTVTTGLNTTDFGTITRSDGTLQTTYKGWPLYYYQSDAKAGDVNGDPVGNVWFVAKSDYTVMLANTQLVGNDGKQYDSTYKNVPGITQYITDDHGRTLYGFNHDHSMTNTFTKSDFSNNAVWPIDTLSTLASFPSILNKSDFANITVFGKTQLTYRGWPLYYFGSDSARRGNTRGVSFGSPGLWPITNKSTVTAP